MANSIGNCLKKLVKEGLVVPCNERWRTGETGSWELVRQTAIRHAPSVE